MPLEDVLLMLEERTPAGLRYDPQGQSMQFVPNGLERPQFDIGFQPRTRLVIYGNSLEVEVTAALGRSLGYDTHMLDAASRLSTCLIDADDAERPLWIRSEH